MLTVRKLGVEQASTYYAKDNYYTKEQGEYYGKLKDELGLQDLTHHSFQQLIKGVNPTTGEHLIHSKQNKKTNVPAFDFTMSPAKSISIAYEVALEKGDTKLANKILKLHDNAVNSTLKHIQTNHIKSRVQKDKKRVVLNTDNMVAAKFQHDVSRSLQPQLHTHSVIMNFTKIDDKYRAIDASKLLAKGSPIVKNLGQFYRQSLKEELENAGFKLRDKDIESCMYELAHVNDEAITASSNRNTAIKAKIEILKKKYPNLTDSQLSLRAFFDTRDKKQDLDNIDRAEVRTKNVKDISKYLDCDQLLKDLNNVKTPGTILAINIDKDIDKLVYQTQKEIKNKYHKTADNIASKISVKINKKHNKESIPIAKIKIETLYKKVKQSQEKQKKELKSMDDILKVNLQKTKLDTQKMFSSVEKMKSTFVNIDRNEIEESVENGRRSNRVKAFTRACKQSTRTAEAINSNIRNVGDVDRKIDTTRQRERGGRDEFERSNDDSNRDDGKYRKEIIITKDDIRQAENGAKIQKNKQNKDIEL
jgi:conjugative relaxase-like TrwC/TraI family protein